jgi:flagellar biogenesis protein FliO
MQARVVAALCNRSFLVLAIVVVIGAFVLAQSSQIPSHPPIAEPPSVAAAGTAAAAAPALAETPSAGTPSGRNELALLTIKTIGGVGLVISLILAGFMLFRRFAPQYFTKRPSERILRLIEMLPIGDKRSIMLVQAGANKLVLTSSPGQISLLMSLPDAAPATALEGGNSAEIATPGASSGKFRNVFELAKQVSSASPAPRLTFPPDIRGKMQELRKALER